MPILDPGWSRQFAVGSSQSAVLSSENSSLIEFCALSIIQFSFVMRHHSHLNTASSIINTYTGSVPLSVFLKQFFSAQKKYGSRDRKQIASLVYGYYRLGKAFIDMSVEERILTACFLCETLPSDFLAFHRPGWNENIRLSLDEKITLLDDGFTADDIFPRTNELSEGIDASAFARSMLVQPRLFIRVRPGRKKTVEEKLAASGIPFGEVTSDCLSLANGTAVDRLIDMDKDAVIQDRNSQLVLNGVRDVISAEGQPISAWDCCAASGGKSILLWDILLGKVSLTVSDIRESIISNLKNRFAIAGIINYKVFVADLTATVPAFNLQPSTFNLIICDAPCTGSGTWSRTPEQLYFFDPSQTVEYAERQRKISANAVAALAPGGLFIYITCSVFKEENEKTVQWLLEKFPLELMKMECLAGYEQQADSMFVAVLKRT